MSAVPDRGIEDLEHIFYAHVLNALENKNRRQPTFLRRSLIRSLFKMGSLLSSPKKLAATPQPEEDGDLRPAKRRKIIQANDKTAPPQQDSPVRRPFGHVSSIRNHSRPQLPTVPVASFYGKSRSTSASAASENISNSRKRKHDYSLEAELIKKEPPDFMDSMRVDITDINPDGEGTIDEQYPFPDYPSNNELDDIPGYLDIKCRCSVAIYTAKNDQDPGNIAFRDHEERCRLVKKAMLRVTISDDHQVTRKIVSDPFIFYPKDFMVNRRARRSDGKFASESRKPLVADFPDSFVVEVDLEPIGENKYWPSLEASSAGSPSPRRLQRARAIAAQMTGGDLRLTAKIRSKANSLLGDYNEPLSLLANQRFSKHPIPYNLGIGVRWAGASHWNYESRKVIKSEFAAPSFLSPRSRRTTLTPTREVPADVEESPANSRVHRRRSGPSTYNLKALSDRQLNRSPKKQGSRALESDCENEDEGGGLTVIYSMVAGVGQRRIFKMHTLHCPFCRVAHKHANHLVLHLQTEHETFSFTLLRSRFQKTSISVDFAPLPTITTKQETMDLQKTYQLMQAKTLFDLEKYIKGEDTWLKSRIGPDDNKWPKHLLDAIEDDLQSTPEHIRYTPPESRHSSPNTSALTDDLEPVLPDPKLPSIRPRKKILVPKTSKPLYHTVTKRILEPGEEVPSSDDEKDETWLHHKTRVMIDDYGDITSEEKDYINKWNPFIVEEHLTSDAYFARSLKRFVEKERLWFAERECRKREWLKLMELYIVGGVVNQNDLHECFKILQQGEKEYQEAQKQKQAEDAEEEASKEKQNENGKGPEQRPPPKPRGINECICGNLVLPPQRIVCSGKVSFPLTLDLPRILELISKQKCRAKFYHKTCAVEPGRDIGNGWLCDQCFS